MKTRPAQFGGSKILTFHFHRLQNLFVKVESDQKLNQLVDFLLKHKDEKVIVYFLTCACVNFFWWALRELEPLKQIPIFSLHGQVPAKKRIDVYNSFVALEKGVLLSTDLSARGLDFQDVDWIVQFDPPQDPNFFIHRIGRTARSGRDGKAVVYLMPNEEAFVGAYFPD
jgi:ATP-dependent RNA helicase DDX55/SPB4